MDPKAQLGQGWSQKLKVYFLEFKNHFLFRYSILHNERSAPTANSSFKVKIQVVHNRHKILQ